MIKPRTGSKITHAKSPSKTSPKNKELVQKCLELVRNGDEELSPEQMRAALQKIALEVQRYQSDTTSDDLTSEDNYKSKLKIKRKQIKNLRDNLSAACLVAKTLTSSNEEECQIINMRLHTAKNETATLQQKNSECNDFIQKLNTEKQTLDTKFQNLKNFIELGFKQLQRLRKEEDKDLPIEFQLKEIIVSCGQYYADFCNEHEKCSQLEQRNRFLTTKITFLERKNMDETKSENTQNYQKRCKTHDYTIGYVRSEYKLAQEINVGRATIEPVQSLESFRTGSFPNGNSSMDLTTHMTLVKDLLKDQDAMLSELKKLSEELSYN